MGQRVKEFFRQSSGEEPHSNFHRVIALHEAPDVDWKNISKLVPDLCKGWYELAHLPSKDRIEFIRDFWLKKLPYRQGFNAFIVRFFEGLEDIGIYVTQHRFDDPYQASLVYSLKGDNCFYRGGAPASDEKIVNLQKFFSDDILPADYKAFLQIHDGFWKTTDCTGITRSVEMPTLYSTLQELLAQQDRILTSGGLEVDPKRLIPFYESFGMPYFQCFWGEWYPEEEMGNVYYSGLTNTISFEGDSSPENMAFPTFLDWLQFYLEKFA